MVLIAILSSENSSPSCDFFDRCYCNCDSCFDEQNCTSIPLILFLTLTYPFSTFIPLTSTLSLRSATVVLTVVAVLTNETALLCHWFFS